MPFSVVQAYRWAEDAAQISSYLMGNNPYTCNLVTIAGAQRSVGQTGELGSRNSQRIVVAAMFGADGYITYGPPELDGYINPYARDMKSSVPLLSAQSFTEMEWMVGPLVFPYDLNNTNGGTDPNLFYPNQSNVNIYVQLLGPGLNPTNGQFFKIQEVVLGKGDNIYYHLRLIGTSEVT